MPKRKKKKRERVSKKEEEKAKGKKIPPVHISKAKTESFVYKFQVRGECGEASGQRDRPERDPSSQRGASWFTLEAKPLGCGSSEYS